MFWPPYLLKKSQLSIINFCRQKSKKKYKVSKKIFAMAKLRASNNSPLSFFLSMTDFFNEKCWKTKKAQCARATVNCSKNGVVVSQVVLVSPSFHLFCYSRKKLWLIDSSSSRFCISPSRPVSLTCVWSDDPNLSPSSPPPPPSAKTLIESAEKCQSLLSQVSACVCFNRYRSSAKVKRGKEKREQPFSLLGKRASKQSNKKRANTKHQK